MARRIQATTELAESVRLASIGCELNLADIYRRVEFPAPALLLRPPGSPATPDPSQ